MRILLGIPLVSYFGDFGAHPPAFLGKKAIASLAKVCAILGIKPKLAKSKVGIRATCIGVEGSCPSPPNGIEISAQIAQSKAPRRIDTTKRPLSEGRAGRKDLESLIGELGFSQTSLFAKFARCQLRAIYLKIHRKWYPPTISSTAPRVVASPSTQADFVIYTDAPP